MKKNITVASIVIGILFFCIPFFWLKSGFVDLGSDGGRLYFLDPLGAYSSLYKNQNFIGIISYAMIPYFFFLYGLKFFLLSPTFLIAFEHGLQLSLGFYFVYIIIKLLLNKHSNDMTLASFTGILGGIIYIGLITVFGWQSSLLTHNQVFLNPLLFFLFLKYLITEDILYGIVILLVTVIFSGSFGFAAAPQLFSFFPLACLFLLLYISFVVKKTIPWKGVFFLSLCFLGLHAFHLFPFVISVFDKGNAVYSTLFTKEAIGSRGVYYFDFNHKDLGKISLELFQPSQWHGQTVFIFLVPLVALLGFLKKPSKLLALLGIFFAITFFLVSANITNLGVQLYRSLFYIPGFSMFRSFNEKWYFVYAFFYALLFGISFYQLFLKKRAVFWICIGLMVIASVGYRIFPFLQGNAVNTVLWQSKNVSSVFRIDPDLLNAIDQIKVLPQNGNIITMPLTFPYMQVAYGKEGGAYMGISFVQFLGGRKDFPGFWSFGPYEKNIFDALREENIHDVLQLFSFLNIRYLFHNSDIRIMDDFPGYPYIFPGGLISSKEQVPLIKDQEQYKKFFSHIPLTKVYEKGFYRLYEFDDHVVRPTVYVPDALYASRSAAMEGDSYRSAFGDETACRILSSFSLMCDGEYDPEALPSVTFTKRSETAYDVSVDTGARTKPFILIFLEEYHPSWTLKLNNATGGITHVRLNDYANAWIVEPENIGTGIYTGTIQLGFQKYYTYGWIISGITGGILIIGFGFLLIRRRHEKK